MPHNTQILKSWQELKANWRNDLIAGLSVALVALPLGIGIALASGAPPMSGLIPSIIGGLMTTFIRGSHLGINGPAAGLIAVTLSATKVLGDDIISGYPYVLAAIIISGILQMLMGLFKMGKLGSILPSSVIHGMLAAIGIIILIKQLPMAFGVSLPPTSTLQSIISIPQIIFNQNPFVTIISLNTLMILIFHPKIKSKFIHFIPGTIWAILFAIPFVYFFNFFEYGEIYFLKKVHEIGPYLLVRLPDKLANSLIFPNFSKIGEFQFWIIVISITLVSTIETLLSSKAVDKLDPYHRTTNHNKDLSAMGLSTILSGLIGGLPVITVIVRSSVNINNGGKTKWSNFYHGVIILVFVLIFSGIIQKIPLATLAGILIFTGYKLSAPRIYKDAYIKGPEQLVILLASLIITLLLGLIWGILIGTVITLFIHFISSRLSIKKFFVYLFNSSMNIVHLNEENIYYIKIRGIANFLHIPKLETQLLKIPPKSNTVVDFTHTSLVGHTMLEYIHDYQYLYNTNGGALDLTGLDIHRASSDHPDALHTQGRIKRRKSITFTKRQIELQNMAAYHKWTFDPKNTWNISNIKQFQFFETRPIEYKRNILTGKYSELNTAWEISDITYDEGVLLATEVYHTTAEYLTIPFTLPKFVLEKEVFFDKLMQFAGYEDIDFKIFTEFSKEFTLKSSDKQSIEKLFTPDLIRFFEYEDIYHLECNGSALLLFRRLRLASPREILKMNKFSHNLVRKLSSVSYHKNIERFK